VSRPSKLTAFLVFLAILLIIAVQEPRYGVVMLPVALFVYWRRTTSPAGRIAEALFAFEDRPVDIRVWGQPLVRSGTWQCRIERVVYFGPSIRLYVKYQADARAAELEIARPRDGVLSEHKVDIREATYVRWAGTTLTPSANALAVTLVVLE